MKILEKTKEMLQWLSVFNPNENETGRRKGLYIAYTSVTIISALIGVFATYSYGREHFSIDFESSMYAFLQTFCYCAMIYSI